MKVSATPRFHDEVEVVAHVDEAIELYVGFAGDAVAVEIDEALMFPREHRPFADSARCSERDVDRLPAIERARYFSFSLARHAAVGGGLWRK